MKRILAVFTLAACAMVFSIKAPAETVSMVTVMPQAVAAFVKLDVSQNATLAQVNMGPNGNLDSGNTIVANTVYAKSIDTKALMVNSAGADVQTIIAKDMLVDTRGGINNVVETDNLVINGVTMEQPPTSNITWATVTINGASASAIVAQ